MRFVPSRYLLWLVGVAVIPAVLAGPWPQLIPLWLFSLGFIAVLALGDLAMSRESLAPPAVGLPPVVRLAKDREGTLPLILSNPGGRARRVRLAVVLPAGFESPEPELWITLSAGGEQARVDWRCTPRRRGRFTGLGIAAESGSRLGLWRLRARSAPAVELRVYPNLFSERRPFAALFLARGRPGIRLQRTVGRGREFEKLWDYLPGDGFDEVHWKATAKRGRPVTKIFQAERTQEIYVILDRSRLSAWPTGEGESAPPLLERSLTAAMVLLLAAERQGDRFGLAAYDDRLRLFLRAGGGSAHYAACREAALGLESSEATPDLAEVVRHLRMQIRRRALLFFLTDLADPVLAEDFVRHVGVLARQHLVLVGQLRPPEVGPLYAGAEAASDAEVYGRLAGHLRWTEMRAVAQRLKPLGVSVAWLEQETMAGQLVGEYLQVKRRQAL